MGSCLGSPVKPTVVSPVKPTVSSQKPCINSEGPSTSRTATSSIKGVPNHNCSSTTSSSKQSSNHNSSSSSNRTSNIKGVPNLRVYTRTELKRATTNFSPQSLIGEGEFGEVFKGWIDPKSLRPAVSGCGVAVAVKRYRLGNMQGLQEWQSEVKILGSLAHPNVVKLYGYCRGDSELLLVYEFMAFGNLDFHLFGRGAALKPLTWSLRLKIAIGAARGLAYLHASEKQVIYRDIKTSNILLDSGHNAKLSDFGLAKNGPTEGDTHVSTGLKGTYAYAAPEYIATGHLYPKSDVYGFGVVLLEILSGHRACERPDGEQYLVEWARALLADHKKTARLMDPRLDGQYPSRGALRLAQITLRCLARDRESRPSMQRVVQALEQIEATSTARASAAGNPISIVQATIPHCLPLPPFDAE